MNRFKGWGVVAKIAGAVMAFSALYLQQTVISANIDVENAWVRRSLEQRLELIWRAQGQPNEAARAKFVADNAGVFSSSSDEARKAKGREGPAEQLYLLWVVAGALLLVLPDLLELLEAGIASRESTRKPE